MKVHFFHGLTDKVQLPKYFISIYVCIDIYVYIYIIIYICVYIKIYIYIYIYNYIYMTFATNEHGFVVKNQSLKHELKMKKKMIMREIQNNLRSLSILIKMRWVLRLPTVYLIGNRMTSLSQAQRGS